MRDRFFELENCERCGKSLNGCRIMSMLNTQTICMDCKQKETQRADYAEAVKAENDAVKRGERNFKGKGF